MSAHRKPKGSIEFDEYEYVQSSVISSSGHRKPKAAAVLGGVDQRPRLHPAFAVAGVAAALMAAPAAGAMTAAMTAPHAPVNPVNPNVGLANATALTASQLAAAAVASPAPAKPAAPAATPATTPAQTTVAAIPAPWAHTTLSALEPEGLYGSQEFFNLSSTQWANAKTIVKVAYQRGMSPYAAVIAVATASQESSLINLTSADNADSLGLFQQRPSMGWGTASQITTPTYAANKFLQVLQSEVPDYNHTGLWQAAQRVQKSGYPTAYAQWQLQAANIVMAIINGTAP
ncbi:MAG TPA: hypothetical protein VGX23_08305 [Actinocrinis sp.]|nr:hypothetical protein [Actinocrinis sp.]